MKKLFILIFLSSSLSYTQNAIVAAGNSNETIGSNLVRMQEFDTIIEEISLGTPTFEAPIEQPKPIIKKKTIWEKFIESLQKLFG